MRGCILTWFIPCSGELFEDEITLIIDGIIICILGISLHPGDKNIKAAFDSVIKFIDGFIQTSLCYFNFSIAAHFVISTFADRIDGAEQSSLCSKAFHSGLQ